MKWHWKWIYAQIYFYAFGKFVSGSSNACVDETPGMGLACFGAFLVTGTKVDKTVFMIVWSCWLFPSLRIEMATFEVAGLFGIPVDEFLLWLADEILELSVEVAAEVNWLSPDNSLWAASMLLPWPFFTRMIELCCGILKWKMNELVQMYWINQIN